MSGEETAVTTFGEYGDKTTVGVVLKIDPIDRIIKPRRERKRSRSI